MKRTAEFRRHQYEVKEKRLRDIYRKYEEAREKSYKMYLVPFKHPRDSGRSIDKITVKPQFRNLPGLVDAVESTSTYHFGYEHFYLKPKDPPEILQYGITIEEYNSLEPKVQSWFYRPEYTGIDSSCVHCGIVPYRYHEKYFCRVSRNWLEVKSEKKIWYSQYVSDGKAESEYSRLWNYISKKGLWKKIAHDIQHCKNWDRAEWKLEKQERELECDKYIENQEIKEALLTIHEHITPRKDPDESSEIAA